mmetsp:Transcript_44/g.90  ORF Transcript_44/g.90 Transcript_44/m.90 type:complete len:219 (+) Transcript_44:89-745(+)
MPSEEIGFLEKHSGTLNALQLVAGVTSLVLYSMVTSAQQRFFPFTAATVAGTMEISFARQAYMDLQLVNGFSNVISSLLFLGKDSFCVSSTVYVNLKPAHQLCYDWRWGVLLSIALAGVAALVSFVGGILSGVEVASLQGVECVELLWLELQCNGALPTDIAKREAAVARIEDLGAISCMENMIKTYLAIFYLIWYALCFGLSSVGFQAARVYIQEQG